MNLPTLQSFWHGFAQRSGSVCIAFAMVSAARHCRFAGHWQSGHGTRSLRCYPSPTLRSGPSQAGPILMCGSGHDCVGPYRNCFQIRDVAVESSAITTNQRGSIPCVSRLSSSLFSQRPWPAACRTRRRAAWPARLLARLSLTLWTKTCWPAPHLAGWPDLRPVASSWACRPATRATESPVVLATFGRLHTTRRTIRADRPGGPFAFA
jgi:hypothetical protein